MTSYLIFVVIFCGVVLCVPPNPHWPTMFSAGIDLINIDAKGNHEVSTGHWYWDESKNAERHDLHRHLFREVKIRDYTHGTQHLYENEDHKPWNCTLSTIAKKMPVYDFSDLKYVTDETHRGITVHVWEHSFTTYNFKYLSRADNGDPVRLEIDQTHSKQREVLDMFDVDKGAQDKDIFNASLVFPKITCKNHTSIHDKISRLNSLLPPSVCDKTADCAKRYATCGCPYVWGGNSCSCGGKGGLDCSGIVHTCYVANGYNGIARTAEAQAHQGSSCGSCTPSNTVNCAKGDLFFYNTEGKGISHVIMYIGGGEAAECPHTGLNCRVLKPYTAGYVSCRRLCA